MYYTALYCTVLAVQYCTVLYLIGWTGLGSAIQTICKIMQEIFTWILDPIPPLAKNSFPFPHYISLLTFLPFSFISLSLSPLSLFPSFCLFIMINSQYSNVVFVVICGQFMFMLNNCQVLGKQLHCCLWTVTALALVHFSCTF